MDNVLCPHCGQAVLGDPPLAGRVIACPACRGQFTMPVMAALAPGKAVVPPAPPPPPPVIQSLQFDLSPPVIVTPPPQSRRTAAKRPSLNQSTVLIAGIAVAALFLVGVGLVVVLNWSPGKPGTVTASGTRSRGNRASSNGDGQRSGGRRDNSQQHEGGGEVEIGDNSVSDDPTREYGGFVFGIREETGQPPMVITKSGDEPIRIPRSFSSDKATVQRFLELHHGAANVQIEQLTDEPYYLAHLAIDGGKDAGQVSHGRSRQAIQRNIDLINDGLPERFTIGRLERMGTVVRAEYRLQKRSSAMRSDEEFLVVNGKVVNRLGSSRTAARLGGD